MNYKMVFTGRKNVKGLSQKSTAIVTGTSSPCKIVTGHTHAEFQTTVSLYLQVPHPQMQPNRSKIFRKKNVMLLMCTRMVASVLMDT